MLFNDKASLLNKCHVTIVWFESTTETPVEVKVFLKHRGLFSRGPVIFIDFIAMLMRYGYLCDIC